MVKLFERWIIRPYLEWKYKRVSEKVYQTIYDHFTAPNNDGGWPLSFRGMYYDATIEVLGFEPAARLYLEAKKRFPNLTLAFDGNGGWDLVGTVGTQYVYYYSDFDKMSITKKRLPECSQNVYLGEL